MAKVFPNELKDIESTYYKDIVNVPNEYKEIISNIESRMSRMALRMIDLYSKVGQYGVNMDLIRRDFSKSYNSIIKEFYHKMVDILANKNGIEDKDIKDMAYDFIKNSIKDDTLNSAINFSSNLEDYLLYLDSDLGRTKTRIITNINTYEFDASLRKQFLDRAKMLDEVKDLELFEKGLNNFWQVRTFRNNAINRIVAASTKMTDPVLFSEYCYLQNRLNKYLNKCVKKGCLPEEYITQLFNHLELENEDMMRHELKIINDEFDIIKAEEEGLGTR